MLLRRVLRSLSLPLHDAATPARGFRGVSRSLLLGAARYPMLAPAAAEQQVAIRPRRAEKAAAEAPARRGMSTSESGGASLVSILEREERLEKEEEAKNGGPMTPDLAELRDVVSQQMEIGEEANSNLVTLSMDFEGDAGRERVKVFFNVQEYQEDEQLEEGDAEDSPGNIYPFEVRILKKDRIMRFFCQATAQQFTIENVVVSADNDINADFDEVNAYGYQGPSFDDLEPDLQQAFVDFLHQRYVDDTLACFIAGYADYKEQQNYLGWLADARTFLA